MLSLSVYFQREPCAITVTVNSVCPEYQVSLWIPLLLTLVVKLDYSLQIVPGKCKPSNSLQSVLPDYFPDVFSVYAL